METIEAVFFATRLNNSWQREEDLKYFILTQLSEVCGTLYLSLDSLHGQRKINAENTFKKLSNVCNHLGKFYLDEMKAKKDLLKANQALLEASTEIDRLKSEIETLKKIDEL